jgi:putative hydrolase of the HAD superfamily
MKSKGIRNLLIDFGGVLISLHRQRCIDAFKALGVESVEEQLDIFHQGGLFLDFEKGLTTCEQFRNSIRQLSTNKLSDSQIDDAWNSFIGDIPHYKLDLLLKLREKYMVYLLSNTNKIHWDWSCKNSFPYRAFDVNDYFEKIYLSFEMHVAKPSAEMFERVIADANIDPKETLFIDDSAENCKVAASLGISTYTPAADEDWSHLFK